MTSRSRVSLIAIAALVVVGPVLGLASTAVASTTTHTPYQTGRVNAGTPKSTNVTKNSSGNVVSYGNSAITYTAPSPALTALGQSLFLENCASCHGTQADGVPANGTS